MCRLTNVYIEKQKYSKIGKCDVRLELRLFVLLNWFTCNKSFRKKDRENIQEFKKYILDSNRNMWKLIVQWMVVSI